MCARVKSRLTERTSQRGVFEALPDTFRKKRGVRKKDGEEEREGEKKLTVCCKKVEWLRTLAGFPSLPSAHPSQLAPFSGVN